jgi:hypothetical protein
MNRSTLALYTLLAVASAGRPLAGQAADSLAITPDLFPVGETLLYDARFGIITLGSGMMQIAGVDTIRGVPSLHVVFRLESGNFLFPIDDRMDSWMGLADFASRRFIQEMHEGGNNRYTAYEIYPDSGYYTQEGVDSIMPTSPEPLDDAAFFYFVRTVPLEVGERYVFERYFRPDRNPVVLEVLERDTLDLPAGRFPTLVIKPTIQGRGILAEAQEPRMWITDDDRRLMVQLKSTFASIATITLRLREIIEPPPDEPGR